MADFPNITVRIADYAPVKAVLDAASDLVEAKESAPWAVQEALEVLSEKMGLLGYRKEEERETYG